MSIRFEVSAPGKIILNGEHSVVYGKPALAGVVSIRNTLIFETSTTMDSQIIIKLDKMAINIELNLQTYNSFLEIMCRVYQKDQANLPKNIAHNEFLSKIEEFVNTILVKESDKQFFKAFYSIFYLLTGICISNGLAKLPYGFQLTMKSGITIGAGLGSSASFAVCFSTAFYFFAKIQQSPDFIQKYNNNLNSIEQKAIKSKISDWAFYSEKIQHGNPSGLDNTICVFGNIMQFYRGQIPVTVKLLVPFNILLVNTGICRNTSELVKRVADLHLEYPTLIEGIFNSMSDIVDNVVEIIENAALTPDKQYENLKKMFNINNNLLRAINVSHPSLEQIFYISERYGFSSKLTGAGGGGYAIILLPPNYTENLEFKELCNELTNNKFKWQTTTIGGSGVDIKII